MKKTALVIITLFATTLSAQAYIAFEPRFSDKFINNFILCNDFQETRTLTNFGIEANITDKIYSQDNMSCTFKRTIGEGNHASMIECKLPLQEVHFLVDTYRKYPVTDEKIDAQNASKQKNAYKAVTKNKEYCRTTAPTYGEDFKKNILTCTPTTETTKAKAMGLDVIGNLEIIGLEGNSCVYQKSEGDALSQEIIKCKATMDELKSFADIIKDNSYNEAFYITQNCKKTKKSIFAQKLSTCEAFKDSKNIEFFGQKIKITTKITKQENGDCKLEVIDESTNTPELETCMFSALEYPEFAKAIYDDAIFNQLMQKCEK